jgi:hypothetical protein
MGLDIAQKAGLIQRFAPVLFLEPGQTDFPVRPEAFIERSALWSARVPYDNKMLWGQGVGDVRSPLIPRGGIRFDPIDPIILEHADAELWFETAGWARADLVDAATDNRTCKLDTPAQPYQLNVDGPWFYAEVGDADAIASWFHSPMVQGQVGLDLAGFMDVAGPVHMICYYFLFPHHLEAGALARADGSLEPAGNYEGDWACYCVITRAVEDQPENDEPLFAGFSRRRRGASPDFATEYVQEYMELLPWQQVRAAGDHAGVVVALGTHNLYPLDSPQGEPGGINPQWFDFGSSISEPANKFAQDTIENPASRASSAVTLAKVLAGLAIGGPIGAIVGAIAGAAEAEEIHEGLHEEPELEPPSGAPPEWPDDLEDPRDKLLEPSESHGIVPQGQDALIQALTGAPVNPANVSLWLDDGERTVVDRTVQLFWSDGIIPSHAFGGRWGVRCSDDPFNRRAGCKFPEFRLQVLKRLVAVV